MTGDAELTKTPLNTWHKANGGQMIDFGGWEMPVQYKTGIIEEHLAVRKAGGLFDVSHMGRFRIKGKDRIAFLQHVLSNNAEALEPWQAQYTLVPNQEGGAIDDAYLYRFGEEDYLLVVNAANRGKVWDHFQEQARDFGDVRLEDHTHALGMIAFQGPGTKAVLEKAMEGGRLPEPMRNRLSEGIIAGTPIPIARTGYTGEPLCFELFPPADKTEAVWSALYETGRDMGILPIGLGARDTLRLEAGMPLYGHELGLDPEGKEIPIFAITLAPMAVSFNPRKGSFVGREALERQFQALEKIRNGLLSSPPEALPRRIHPVAIQDKGIARQGDEVLLRGEKVGVVTSGTMIPYWIFEGEGATMTLTGKSARRAIALALVDSTLQPDTDLEISVRRRRLKGKIVRWHGRSEAPPYFRSIPVDFEKPKPGELLGQGMEKAEILLKKGIENHIWRQTRCINLIPSEQTPSPLVRLLSVSDPVGRYAEHRELLAAFEQEVFYYQGTDFIAWVEERLKAEMADYLGCPLVEVRPVSGQMANMTVFSAFVDFKNRTNRKREAERIRLAMNNHIGKGGHLSSQPMGALRDYIARDPLTDQYAVINFPVMEDNPYRIDVEATGKLLEQVNPEVIIFGKSMVLHPEPIAEIRKLVEGHRPRPLIMYDMAHVLGLVGPHFQEPFREGADIVTGSTHKTFFGTQRGVVGGDFEENTPGFELWEAIERRAFPGMVSNHHLGSLLGLLLATIEMNTFKDEYQAQVIRNAKAFARGLKEAGLQVEGDPKCGYTETHQVILNVGYGKGPGVARILEMNNIIVNYQATPFDESFTASSALRMGVSEMTRFGMKEKDFEALAHLLAEAVRGKNVKEEIVKLRSRFLELGYCLDDGLLAPLKKQLIDTF
ncbi:MAG: glycine cleavage system aminomethyltransferase GcvT [Deltaproteobacteria bacterium]|nr:glycine cleavage system aminomethyltransferase GcvT [Deltaproteobacteria bacterium]